MDQVSVVNEQIDSGKRLVEMLSEKGFEVRIAFWTKPTEADRWYFYLASQFVDKNGHVAAYLLIHAVLRATPDLWLDPFEIKVLGLDDSLTQAASAVRRSRSMNITISSQSPKPFPGMTRFGGPTLGGLDVDGALIYPP